MCAFRAGEEKGGSKFGSKMHEALMDGRLDKGGLERGNKAQAQMCKSQGWIKRLVQEHRSQGCMASCAPS